jgi:hypothetical protein
VRQVRSEKQIGTIGLAESGLKQKGLRHYIGALFIFQNLKDPRASILSAESIFSARPLLTYTF